MLLQRNFWPYFVGNLSSNIGTWFQNLAMALLIYRITGSVTWVAIVNFSQFAATVLLVGWTGPADRYDRRRLVMCMQAMAAAITVALTVLSAFGWASAPGLVVAALLVGVSAAFAVPAMQALLPQLVPASDRGSRRHAELGHLQPGAGRRPRARRAGHLDARGHHRVRVQRRERPSTSLGGQRPTGGTDPAQSRRGGDRSPRRFPR